MKKTIPDYLTQVKINATTEDGRKISYIVGSFDEAVQTINETVDWVSASIHQFPLGKRNGKNTKIK